MNNNQPTGDNKDEKQSAAVKPSLLSRVVREPLTVFMLVAMGIFAYDAWFADYGVDDSLNDVPMMAGFHNQPIVVTDSVETALIEEFSWLYGRDPDQAEIDLMVQRWIEDEVVFREALVQGMHFDDAMVRAVLIDKVRLLWAGLPDTPSESDMLEYYMENIERYQSEPRVSFEQVFFQEKPQDYSEILTQLKQGNPVNGDGFWLGDRMDDYGQSILRSNFGGRFYESLINAPIGEWAGPFASSRGYHFVLLSDLLQPMPQPYESIRDRIVRDWQEEQRNQRIGAETFVLMQNHNIVRDQSDD